MTLSKSILYNKWNRSGGFFQPAYEEPDAINEILGVDVSRCHPLYQYALFCVTRLADSYRAFMFPDVFMSLGSFREDAADYISLCSELYQDLAFDERTFISSRVDAESDKLSKAALTELAYFYWVKASNLDPNQPNQTREADACRKKCYDVKNCDCVSSTSVFSVDELIEQSMDHTVLEGDSDYCRCYSDTVKLVITDLERKEIWQMSTLFSNKV